MFLLQVVNDDGAVSFMVKNLSHNTVVAGGFGLLYKDNQGSNPSTPNLKKDGGFILPPRNSSLSIWFYALKSLIYINNHFFLVLSFYFIIFLS